MKEMTPSRCLMIARPLLVLGLVDLKMRFCRKVIKA